MEGCDAWPRDSRNGLQRGNDIRAREFRLDELRKEFTTGGFKVMGEIGLQYEGISPSDHEWTIFRSRRRTGYSGSDPYGHGRIRTSEHNVLQSFADRRANPLLLEELLARHPKLRVQVMHAGYPMIDNMLTLLQANSHVYVDVAGLIWSYPMKEVNHYIQRLVDEALKIA